MLALPAAHPLARRRRIALTDLGGTPLFWFERARQPAFFDHCEAIFARHGFRPNRLRKPADHHVLLAGVAAGRGLALLPSSFAAIRRLGVVYRRLVEGEALSIGIGVATAASRPGLRARLMQAVADVRAGQRPAARGTARRGGPS